MSSAAALLIAGGAWAQETEAECADENACAITLYHTLDVVEVAGIRALNRSELTSSHTVLEGDDLLIRNVPNIADQLRAVPGVGVSGSGGPGALTQIRMRGAEANHTLVLLNGIEVSDPTTGETDFGVMTGLPTARVDVLRGEQSAIYGSDAIGGVIGLSTPDRAQATGLVEIGTHDTARAELGFVRETGDGYGGTFGASLSGFTTAGVDTAGLDGEKDGASAYGGSVFGKTRLGGSDWQLGGLAIYRASDVETDPDSDFDGRLDNADRETESEQFIVGASLSGDTGPVNHIFKASYNSVDRENSANGQFTDETKGERTKISWSPSIRPSDAHQISGLIEFETEDYERISTDTFFGDPNQSQSFDTIGFAGEYRLKLENGLNLSASARHDLNDDRFDDATTWRIGAAYAFDFDARLRASVGAGVKNPTFTELFGFFPAQFIGNPDLKPEKSLGWEIGWDQSIQDVTFSATYFEAELEDEIVTQFTPTFASTPANLSGDSERKGFELAAMWEATETLSINASASFIDSENDSGVDEIRVPGETASLSLAWRSPDKEGVRAGLAFDYVADQRDTDFGSFQTVNLDAYTLVSASAEYPVSERISLTLRGENLLDEDAIDVIGFNKPGAGVFVGLKIR